MPIGTVCFPIDHGPSRLMLFDLGRGTGVPLPVGLWVDSLASWDEALLVWGWPQGDPRPTVWLVDPAGAAEPFGPLDGRQVHGMAVGSDGTVVVGVPFEGADPDVDFSTFRTMIIPARPPAPPAGPVRVVGADTLGSQGTVRVQLRGSDSARLAAILTAAAVDLVRLDTTEPEGQVETPSFVSDVQTHPMGPWVWIDANDTEPALLDRIPVILQRHLEAAGITEAVIDLAPDV
jgi:hypothetical protein